FPTLRPEKRKKKIREISLAKFVKISLEAMQKIAPELGL
ncbi:MAG: hypothetical protein UV41_C0048G0001, partial [Candidatus Daviesbacteria bacterium GW2011_GWA2_42_7]